MTLISKVLTQAISNSSLRRWGGKGKKTWGMIKKIPRLLRCCQKLKEGEKKKQEGKRETVWVSEGGKGREEEEGWGGVKLLCVVSESPSKWGDMCAVPRCQEEPWAVCPVSGGSGSPLSYQAKTRVSSAGAHSHSLILLRCTLKEPSSGAKQRQPANLTTTLHLLLISNSSS